MLLQRILTALVLIPLVVLGILRLPTPYVALILAVVILVGAWEWSRLAGWTSLAARSAYLLLVALLLGSGWALLRTGPAPLWPTVGAALWWLLVLLILARYRPGAGAGSPPLKGVAGVLVLVPAWFSLVAVHGAGGNGPRLMLFLMVLIWVADTCAYFSGRRFGRIRLAPSISPGKTREGVYGALAGAALCGLLLQWLLAAEAGDLPLLIGFCLLLALVSVIGDLFESLMKRQAGLKDSGRLLPGHGGMLDRIDSLTAAAPLYLLGLQLLGAGR
ncbi:MAG TPA: phosphatidate cytidylyltransferase [Sedimenticola thiotaurini]|uniref:Phosphatidate cytidylyltransferase n=1 Tax=Sedimenticola thiotaurini TaxID=1543721 RepID=A0A831W9A4_9GAMM|nr:phosphatidate cytidylyltransferase [Sedimenticola thiotaurini]